MKAFRLTEYDMSLFDVQAIVNLTFDKPDKFDTKFVESVNFSDLRILAPGVANLGSDAINRNCK